VGTTVASCPSLKSTASSEWSFTLALVTAAFFSCALPTEFFGRLVAA
jgi:hypothetical protein